jgi:hypothetical protein
MLKDTPPADLIAAIRVVAAGDGLLAPSVTRRLIAEFAKQAAPGDQPAADLDGVTDREREVLVLVARGHRQGASSNSATRRSSACSTTPAPGLSKVGNLTLDDGPFVSARHAVRSSIYTTLWDATPLRSQSYRPAGTIVRPER